MSPNLVFWISCMATTCVKEHLVLHHYKLARRIYLSFGFQECHNEVLLVFSKYRQKEATLDDFLRCASETGYIDLAEDAFTQSLQADPKNRQEQLYKLHPTMVRLAFRELKKPHFVALPRVNEPMPEEIEEMGLHPNMFQFLMGNANVAPKLVKFGKQIIETGRIEIASSFSDDVLSTDRGFMFYLGGKPYILYIFQAVEPVVLVANPNMGNIIACYLPSKNTVIGQNVNYDRIIAHFKTLCLKHSTLLRRYLTHTEPCKPTLIVGFMQHVGHTILNELTGLDTAIQDIPSMKTVPVLLGPHEYVETRRLFPELKKSQLTKIDPNLVDPFEYGLKEHILPVRPTMRHYRVSSNFRARLARVAGHDTSSKRSSLLQRFTSWGTKSGQPPKPPGFEAAKGRKPIIWIEVRSNHRVWLNQVDGIKFLIERFENTYPNAAIFLAGWSRPPAPSEEDNKEIAQDTQIYEQIAAYARDRIPVINGVGLSSEEKLQWAFICNACITTFGSGMTVPCLIANLPSVLHSNKHYAAAPAMNPDPEKRIEFAENLTPYEVISADYITDDPDTDRFQVKGHFVSGEVVYDALERALQRVEY